MTEIYFRCPSTLKKRFENKVGKGNISKSFRSYMEYRIGNENDINILILEREFEILSREKDIILAKWTELKEKLDSYTQAKEIEEIEKLKKEKKLKEKLANMKYETINAHFSEIVGK